MVCILWYVWYSFSLSMLTTYLVRRIVLLGHEKYFLAYFIETRKLAGVGTAVYYILDDKLLIRTSDDDMSRARVRCRLPPSACRGCSGSGGRAPTTRRVLISAPVRPYLDYPPTIHYTVCPHNCLSSYFVLCSLNHLSPHDPTTHYSFIIRDSRVPPGCSSSKDERGFFG